MVAAPSREGNAFRGLALPHVTGQSAANRCGVWREMVELGLAGQRALVMGSTRGMGNVIASGLAVEGATVAVCGRELASAQEASRSIRESRAYSLDLSDDGSVTDLIAGVGRDFGGIDIVVCNGGGPPPGNVAEVAPETWMAQFQKMFVNQVRIVNAFLPGMRERGRGRVLVISSSGVSQPIENLGISNSLRAAQIGWAKTLSNEVAADGVTVNTIQPGRIHTARVDQLDRAAAERHGLTVEETVQRSYAVIPARRYGRVEEFADVAIFLLSTRASYMNGGVIRVDGGMIRGV